MNIRHFIVAVAFAIAGAHEAHAQSLTASADSALAACAQAAHAGDEKTAASQADLADNRFDSMTGRPGGAADGLVGKARVISQCRIPFAALMRKIGLIDESNGLLKRALSVDSLHFAARYTLSLNHYHVPEMFGRTDDAMREMEKLVSLYGTHTIPSMATVYLYLGDVYMRKGRKADAIATWRRGQELHPSETAKFMESLKKVGAAASTEAETHTATATKTAATVPVYEMDAIVVEAGKFSVDDTRGAASLKRMDIITMPGGTADVMQVFQAMPGVTRATEGSDLYVRGGDPAEAPVFVDGARMTYAGTFETLHGGIFGVLDPHSIRKADFSSGGFSARYGNALSGILDITTEGRPEQGSWRAGASLVSAGSSFRTPLGDKVGLWATARGTETGPLIWTQGKGHDYSRTPWSVNGMAGLTFTPAANIEIKATGLTETDAAARNVEVFGYNGALYSSGSTHMALVTARVLNSDATASLRATASAGRRRNVFELGVLDRERNDDMFTARMDADITPRSVVRVRTGVEGAWMRALENGTIPVNAEIAPGSAFSVIDDAAANASHVGGYVETEVSVTRNLAFIAGTRADRLPALDAWTVDPRVAIAYRTNGWTLRTGGGVFHQGSWRTGYRTPNPGAPSGVPTRARHFVVGVEREAPIFIRLEAYTKQYDGYTASAGSPAPDVLAEGQALDRGSMFGVDALIRWKASGSLSAWASYSYLNGRAHTRDSDDWIPSAADVRHTFTGVAKLAFGNNWEIGSTARLASGKPYTAIIGAGTDSDGSRMPLYAATHSSRMPAYARLDARLTRLVPTRDGLFVFYIEGLNLLDRHNVMAYTYDSSYTRRVPIESFFANRTLVFGAEAMF